MPQRRDNAGAVCNSGMGMLFLCIYLFYLISLILYFYFSIQKLFFCTVLTTAMLTLMPIFSFNFDFLFDFIFITAFSICIFFSITLFNLFLCCVDDCNVETHANIFVWNISLLVEACANIPTLFVINLKFTKSILVPIILVFSWLLYAYDCNTDTHANFIFKCVVGTVRV